MKVEVAVLGPPSLISLVVSVDVKQHWKKRKKKEKKGGLWSLQNFVSRETSSVLQQLDQELISWFFLSARVDKAETVSSVESDGAVRVEFD